MASLSDKAGFLISANLIKYAVGFCLPMLMVRVLDKSDFGTYQQLLLVGSLAVGLLTLGLPSSIYFFYNRIEPHQQPALILQTLAMLVAAGLVAAAGIAVAAPMLATRMSNPQLAAYLPLYAVAIGLMLAAEHFVHFMVAQDRYRSAVWFETIETIVRVVTLVLPVLLGFGLHGLVVAALVYALIRFAVRSVWVLRTGKQPVGLAARPTGWFVGQQLGYSIPLWLTAMVGVLGGLLDRAIVAGSFTTIDFAVYSVGALAIPLDVIFQASVADVLRASLPPLVKNGQLVEVTRLLREAVRKLALIMLPSFVFLFGHAGQFITLLFTNEYADSVHVFRIYLLGLPLYMFILSLVPQVFGKTRLNLQIAIVATGLHVVLSFLLLKTLGFYGPAVSAVISSYVATAIYLHVAKGLTTATLSQLLPLPEIAKTLGCAIAALGLSLLVGNITPWKALNFGMKAAVFAAAFMAAGSLLRLFTGDDRRLARRWVAKFLPLRQA
jgi:O-antigen/teichoic acid export membrane protein